MGLDIPSSLSSMTKLASTHIHGNIAQLRPAQGVVEVVFAKVVFREVRDVGLLHMRNVRGSEQANVHVLNWLSKKSTRGALEIVCQSPKPMRHTFSIAVFVVTNWRVHRRPQHVVRRLVKRQILAAGFGQSKFQVRARMSHRPGSVLIPSTYHEVKMAMLNTEILESSSFGTCHVDFQIALAIVAETYPSLIALQQKSASKAEQG
jgi:hypothetical protein